ACASRPASGEAGDTAGAADGDAGEGDASGAGGCPPRLRPGKSGRWAWSSRSAAAEEDQDDDGYGISESMRPPSARSRSPIRSVAEKSNAPSRGSTVCHFADQSRHQTTPASFESRMRKSQAKEWLKPNGESGGSPRAGGSIEASRTVLGPESI